MAFSFESSQSVVSLMSGGGVGVGDRLDTLDTDLVKKAGQNWSQLCPAELRKNRCCLLVAVMVACFPLEGG